MMERNYQNKTLQRMATLNGIYKNRRGKIFSLTKDEVILALFNETPESDKKKERFTREFQEIRRILRKEKQRLIIPIHVQNETLNDSDLKGRTEPIFGKRIYSGWIYVNPNDINTMNSYKAWVNNHTEGMDKSVEEATILYHEENLKEKQIELTTN